MTLNVGLGDKMKRLIIMIIVLGAIASAYFVGHSQGRTSGLEDGVVWVGRSADICKAMRAIAILGVLEKTNYTRVAEALNHDIDYAILGIRRADNHFAGTGLPKEIRREEDALWAAFKDTGTDETTGYRLLAAFRRKHPTQSTDKDVVAAVNQLLKDY